MCKGLFFFFFGLVYFSEHSGVEAYLCCGVSPSFPFAPEWSPLHGWSTAHSPSTCGWTFGLFWIAGCFGLLQIELP